MKKERIVGDLSQLPSDVKQDELNLGNKHVRELKRVCSICSMEKSKDEFYGKGNRLDSACKACQKKKKQAKYVAAKNHDVASGLKSFLAITTLGLSNRIRSEIKKLDEVILCRQKSKR